MTIKMIFTLVIMITTMLNFISSAATNTRPEYIGCQNNDECAPGFCCSILPDKYSAPRCNPLREDGEMCRPKASTFNTTLHYPDGASVELTNVHYIICPCADDLTCDISDGVCRDKNRKNEIHADSNKEDE
ncbi:astakine-like [Belonocnema kinseyi]|uniref:astakine-like n=1 Tax=Belonocnema kinseyi TaxID=2817044 RepID=UPI00143D150F|nr:astakine-like [Belonocnema kinseyi]XP_033215587.1 astakine-like [Belonocnema kinseyi]